MVGSAVGIPLALSGVSSGVSGAIAVLDSLEQRGLVPAGTATKAAAVALLPSSPTGGSFSLLSSNVLYGKAAAHNEVVSLIAGRKWAERQMGLKVAGAMSDNDIIGAWHGATFGQSIDDVLGDIKQSKQEVISRRRRFRAVRGGPKPATKAQQVVRTAVQAGEIKRRKNGTISGFSAAAKRKLKSVKRDAVSIKRARTLVRQKRAKQKMAGF